MVGKGKADEKTKKASTSWALELLIFERFIAKCLGKQGWLKMQEVKMTDHQNPGSENVRHEIAGHENRNK